mgnify:CR=1 FL=1
MVSIMSIKKVIKYLILLFLISYPSKVLALEEGFYSTVSFTIGSIEKEGLEFDETKVVGEYSSNIVRQKTIEYFTEDEYRRRVYDLADKVFVPPFARVDVGYYWYNNTPETVDIEKIRLPLTREIQAKGDLSEILEELPFIQGVTCTETLCRSGKYIEVDGVGLLSSDMNMSPKKGVVIASYVVKPPVEITKYEIEYLDKYLSRVFLYIQNNTKEYLNFVRVNYKTVVDIILDFEPYEEKVLELYKRCDLEEDRINCGSMTIYNNNIKAECAIFGSPFDNYLVRDSISVLSRVGDQWVSGAQTQPKRESFCIQRIPYSYTTEDMIVYLEPEQPQQTQGEYWQELLNFDVLPITSYKINKFNRILTLLKPLGIDNLNIL